MRWTAILLAVMAMVLVTAWCVALTKILGGQNKDWAAWGQAVGSLFAVGAAIWAAHHATEAQARLQRDERRDLIRGIGQAIALALKAYDGLADAMADSDRMEVSRQRRTFDWNQQRALDRYLEMAIERWPSAVLYTQAVSIKAAMEVLMNTAQQFLAGPDLNDETEIMRAAMRFRAAESTFSHSLQDLVR